MATYRTSAGDTIDLICWKYYGRQSGAVEVVMEANRHLADHGPVFEAGVMIELPDLPAPAAKTEIELWS